MLTMAELPPLARSKRKRGEAGGEARKRARLPEPPPAVASKFSTAQLPCGGFTGFGIDEGPQGAALKSLIAGRAHGELVGELEHRPAPPLTPLPSMLAPYVIIDYLVGVVNAALAATGKAKLALAERKLRESQDEASSARNERDAAERRCQEAAAALKHATEQSAAAEAELGRLRSGIGRLLRMPPSILRS
ncbi:hypothetical protein DIPPA_06646 [Diplonema papillatum]|nr:hypothetical protein DIPPA_06646 [Diplonema papillatum]